MTYQVGAENMIDPYADDALVSLSELRDAKFDDKVRFACGSNFVMGESLIDGAIATNSFCVSPINKKVNNHNILKTPHSPINEVSPIKEEQAQEVEMSN